MGSSICTSKPKNLVVIPIPTNQNNEDFSDDEEILLKDSSTDDLTVLELFIKCTNLVAENRFQLLNTVAYVYTEENSLFVKRFETEVQSSTLTPLFTKTLKVNFSLGVQLKLKVEIWEVSKKEGRLLGSSFINIHEVASRSDIIMKDLEISGKRNGNLLVWAKELKQYSDSVLMQWEFESKIFSKGFFLLRLSRTSGSKQSIIYQSETKKPPVFWEKFEVTVNRLCKGNQDKLVLIEILSLDSELVVIASAHFSLVQLKNANGFEVATFSNSVKNGLLKLSKFSYISKVSFIDLIRSGIEIHPFYVIDFSEKTGHSIENLEENPYLNCIKSLQNTLQFYSNDPLYTVLGTGCYFANVSSPSYCFALNGNFFQPEVANHGILSDYYKTTLGNISPAHKTSYGEVMETIIKCIQFEGTESTKFFTLFIISAGDPLDLKEIHEKLGIFSQMPVSVFIMRVPNEMLLFENLQSIKSSGAREFFEYLENNETQQALEEVQSQLVKLASLKDLSIKKVENFRQRSNSIIKNLPEKIRSRSNYFTRVKSEYIEHLTKIGYSNEKIEEVTLIGVPFLVMTEHRGTRLPVRTRTKVMGLRTKSVKPVDFTCGNCNKAVFILAESRCGCKSFCYECVNTSECPFCDKSL